MSLPPFSASGVLPPFVGTPAGGLRSPYASTMPEVVRRFGTSNRRREILRGLLDYRAELRRIGVARAFQWLDGSFVENLQREPNDIDVVTCAEVAPSLRALLPGDRDLFVSEKTKQKFLCDAYWLDLNVANKAKLVERVSYWHGLFSHRRITFEWKGLVQVDLDDEQQDQDAHEELDLLDVESVLSS